MNTALAERPIVAVAAPAVTNDQLDLIRRTIAKDATPDELKLYLYDCERQGVHPLDKLIHFTKRSGKYTPITSIDFMRIRAADTGEYAGSDTALFASKDGVWSSLWVSTDPPIAALVTVWRLVQGQRCKFEAVARWSEYKPDANDFMWKKMATTMLSKCAEACALRKGFPRQLAGLYAKEELDQADNSAHVVASGEGPRSSRPSGAETLTGAALPVSTINTTTGEVIVAMETATGVNVAPPGYHFVRDYSFRNGWHEAYLLDYDSQGGALKVSTKKVCGSKLGDAEAEGVPVMVTTAPKKNAPPGEAYLDTISLLQKAITDAELDAEAAKQTMARKAGEVL